MCRIGFETLLRIAPSETHVTFDNKMYVQHNGVAVGVPLVRVIADILMAPFETLTNKLMEARVYEWHRYVDDAFVLIGPTTNVSNILSILNSFHPSIKFNH